MDRLGICFVVLGVLCLGDGAASSEEANGASTLELGKERILHYQRHIDVALAPDGPRWIRRLAVTDSISLISSGDQIKHGIYLDVPILESSWYFEVLQVQMDGDFVPYHVEDFPYGRRIYVGEAGQTLAPGRHTFRISYANDVEPRRSNGEGRLSLTIVGSWGFTIERVTGYVNLRTDDQVRDPAVQRVSNGRISAMPTQIQNGEFVIETSEPLLPGDTILAEIGIPQSDLRPLSPGEAFQLAMSSFLQDLIDQLSVLWENGTPMAE